MENMYLNIRQGLWEKYLTFVMELLKNGVDRELAISFLDDFEMLVNLYTTADIRADSYQEAIDELSYPLKMKIGDRYSEIFDEKKKQAEEDWKKEMEKDENAILDPRKYLKLVKD